MMTASRFAAEPARRPVICTAAIVVALLSLASPRLVWAQAGDLKPVHVAPVVERLVAAEQVFVGTVVPRRTSVVGSAVEGRVVAYLVNEGDFVAKDQPLAQLLTGTLEIELASAQAELELRQQELRELENGSLPEEIDQAQARMLSAKAAMDYAIQRHTRNETLYNRGQAVTEDEMDKSRSTMIDAQQAYYEAKAAYDLAVKGPREERIARAKAHAAVAAEQVRHIQDRIGKHTIRAPFDGFIVQEMTELGEWVSQAQAVAEMAELNPVDISIAVPEAYIVHLNLGMEAQVQLDALPGEAFVGQVARLVPRADSRSRTFPVKVQVDNPLEESLPRLKAGMLARVALPVGRRQQAMMVPKDALVLGGPSPVVLVVEAASSNTQGKIRQVAVIPGLADESWIQVKGDLKPGELVVTKGNERLRAQDTVQIVAQVAVN